MTPTNTPVPGLSWPVCVENATGEYPAAWSWDIIRSRKASGLDRI